MLLDYIVGYPVSRRSPTADRARCCLTFFFDCLLFMRSPIQVPTRPGAAGLHLRLSRFPGGHPSHCRPSPVLLDLFLRLSPLQVVTHPSADLDRFSWTSSSAVPFFGGHPSHCRPSPVLLDAFLRLSPLQVVTHPSAYLDLDFSWTSSSAVPFSGSHPSHCRPSPVMLDLFLRLSPLQAFCCLLFTHPCPDLARLSWTCSSAIPFSWVTHPTADRAQCCLTLFSVVSSSGGHPS